MDEDTLATQFHKLLDDNSKVLQLEQSAEADNASVTLAATADNNKRNEQQPILEEESEGLKELRQKLDNNKSDNISRADVISQKEALLLRVEVEIIDLELQLHKVSEDILKRNPSIKKLEKEKTEIQMRKQRRNDERRTQLRDKEARKKMMQLESAEIEKEIREEEQRLKLIANESDELQQRISTLRNKQTPVLHDKILTKKVPHLEKDQIQVNSRPTAPPKPMLLPDDNSATSLPDERKVASMRRLFDDEGTRISKPLVKRHQSTLFLNEILGNESNPSSNFVEKKGYLKRKQIHNRLGKVISNPVWSTFYTLLHRRHLLFYKDEHAFDINDAAAYPQDLRGASVESITTHDGKPYTFRLTTSSNQLKLQYIFAINNKEEAEDWIAKIKHKIAVHTTREL